MWEYEHVGTHERLVEMSDIYFTFISIFPSHKSQNYDLVVFLPLRVFNRVTASQLIYVFTCANTTKKTTMTTTSSTFHSSVMDLTPKCEFFGSISISFFFSASKFSNNGCCLTVRMDTSEVKLNIGCIVCAESHESLVKFVPLLSFWRHICICSRCALLLWTFQFVPKTICACHIFCYFSYGSIRAQFKWQIFIRFISANFRHKLFVANRNNIAF